jgi:hypothetical protein
MRAGCGRENARSVARAAHGAIDINTVITGG